MGNKKDSDSIDPRKVYGWEVTDEELEENFHLIRGASYMAYEFALNSTSHKSFSLAEEYLQNLQQQAILPFPLPLEGFTIAQVELILDTEHRLNDARKLLHFVTNEGGPWRGIDDVSKVDLERFQARLTQVTTAFRGGEESFLHHSGSGGGLNPGKKQEKTSEKATSPVPDNNLRLAYKASAWAKFIATHAGVCSKLIYEAHLRGTREHLMRLKNESKNPGLFPKRGYTLAQGKMRLDIEKSAKVAYKAFQSAFDDVSFPIDAGISRKQSLNKLYREFNPQDGKEPQPNIKSFLGSEFFHKKRPTEVPTESQDFWIASDGRKIRRKDAPWLGESNHKS